MVTPGALRGRAVMSIRPGLITKAVLLGQTPLATGELVTEASISDLGAAYKEAVKRENALRPKAKQIRGMTSYSFKTLFKFAQLLGLVELVKEEPMLYPPPGGPLYSIRKPDGVHVVESTRRVFKITDTGREDELCWSNLCKAWRVGTVAPQKLEVPLVTKPPPRKPPRRPPKKVPPVAPLVPIFEPYVLGAKPTEEKLSGLLAHLEKLETLGIEAKGVASELSRITTGLDAWIVEADDMYEDARVLGIRRVMAEWMKIRDVLRVTAEALDERNITGAIALMKELVK